jgi:hypothetical protein
MKPARVRTEEKDMRSYPSEDIDAEELARLNAEGWMLDLLKLNPHYVYWGPYEDYMCGDGQGWNSRILVNSWAENPFVLDELNEVANFYFEVERDSVECPACGGCGHNPETKRIEEAFYDFDGILGRWSDKITQDEFEALKEAGRIRDLHSVEQVNAANSRGARNSFAQHDAINRWILVRTRAERLGVYGKCESCDGHGVQYTEDAAHVNLILWVLHPRKGCSRGIEVKNIQEMDLQSIFEFLRGAAERNQERFSKIPGIAP